MKHTIDNIISVLHRRTALLPVLAIVLTLTLARGIGPVEPAGRKSRGGRWTKDTVQLTPKSGRSLSHVQFLDDGL